MKNRINTAKSRLFASHELYSVVKDQDYQVLVIDAEIDTFGVTIMSMGFLPVSGCTRSIIAFGYEILQHAQK